MKQLFLGLAISLAAISADAQTILSAEPIPAPPKEEMKMDKAEPAPVENLKVSESTHEFGKIPQGKPVTTEFTVTNNTDKAFKLDNVQASCGCTTPVWEKDASIAPGKTAVIKVGYNAASPGPFNKTITITYNGTETKQVFIKGEVWSTPAASAPANDAKKELGN